jgi:NTP pyrophosphatase (non-canonical NTP hydrolase)
MLTKLEALWERQKKYNAVIRTEQEEWDAEFWTQTYLLGIVSEVDEVLRDIKWKRHRKQEGRPIDKVNLGFELADLTKYIISLWEVWGFSSEDMIDFCTEKSEILESALTQEFGKPPVGRNIVIADLDGTVADWRSSFIRWVKEKGNTIDPGMATSMMLDVDMSISYVDYYFMKNRFEGEGGYRNITPYIDAISVIINLQKNYNIYLIVSTARPVNVFHRIWMDTWVWLRVNGIVPDLLRLEKESRVLLASKLQETNKVILLDDDPETILRAANSGIKVYGRRQPYNANINHKNITMVDKYTDVPIESYFE